MNTAIPFGHKSIKRLIYVTGILLLLLIAGYFIANAVIRKKIENALAALPPSLQVQCRSLQANILTGSVTLCGVEAQYRPFAADGDSATVERIAITGISFVQWVTARRLRVRDIRAENVIVHLDQDLMKEDSVLKGLPIRAANAMVDQLEIDSLKVEARQQGKLRMTLDGSLRLDSVRTGAADAAGAVGAAGATRKAAAVGAMGSVGAIRLVISDAVYPIADRNETVRLHHLELDSKARFARLDSLEIAPDRDKEEIGRLRGHQVDVVQAAIAGIEADDLDVMGLADGRLKAGEISLHRGRVYIFRDRRLPLVPGDKPMPVASLESLPFDIRVGKVSLGTTRFEYEEYPREGQKTGILMIERFHGMIEPLLNRPRKGDPAYITVRTEGSLMGSGLVTATMRMPLHKEAFYEVEGAFHDLDLTRLNDPAVNLGQLRLESGMLNSLDFQFEMGEVRSTGKIVGVYHNLVADKLKMKNGQLKTAAFKSFMLKKVIIPRNKDESLPVSKRTGKVDYKRDKQRYFSYYMLHSLLVGVKSSFRLGFLLPG